MARILQIHTQYREPGGEDAVADAERTLLEGYGHEVIGVRRKNAASGPHAAAQLASYSWNPGSTRAIMKIVRQTRPDIAHIHNTWFASSPRFLLSLKRAGVPTVVTIHNYRLACANAQLMRNSSPCELCVGSNPLPGLRYRCYHDSWGASATATFGIQVHRSLGTWKHGVDRFLALTDFMRARLIATGLPAERIAVQPNFVADAGPRRSPPSVSKRVAYIGRLSKEKGLSVALEAWKQAEPANLELAIVGDGPQRNKLMRQASDSVKFLGRLSRAEVDELLLSSRALIVPSLWYEGQPLGVLEAFSAGVPVLGSDIGGLGETIASLGENWRVPPGRNIDYWADSLAKLGDDDMIDSGGATARRTYNERHSPYVALQRLEETYRQVAANESIDKDA